MRTAHKKERGKNGKENKKRGKRNGLRTDLFADNSCPTHGDISLACAPNPQNLRSVWKSLFCTWVAPRAGKVVSATLSLDGRTSTVPVTLTSPEGLNAYGVRMVHQATDLAGLTTTATTATKTTIGTISAAATATATATGGPEPDSGAGLSTGATVAIGVVVPVVVLAALVAGVAWWWRKRRRAPASATSSGSIPAAVPVSVPMEARPTTSIKSSSSAMLQPQELPVPEHLAVEMPSSRLAAELPGDWAHGR